MPLTQLAYRCARKSPNLVERAHQRQRLLLRQGHHARHIVDIRLLAQELSLAVAFRRLDVHRKVRKWRTIDLHRLFDRAYPEPNMPKIVGILENVILRVTAPLPHRRTTHQPNQILRVRMAPPRPRELLFSRLYQLTTRNVGLVMPILSVRLHLARGLLITIPTPIPEEHD